MISSTPINANQDLRAVWLERIQASRLDSRYQPFISIIGLFVFATLPYWFVHLFSYDSEPLPLVIVVVFLFFNLTVLIAVTRTDAFLRRTMVVGIAFKIAAASIHLNVGAVLYEWTVDYYAYVNEGSKWTEMLRSGFTPPMFPFWGTNFVTFVTALLELVVGKSFACLFIIFALLAFWGQYFFYRAFCVAFPTGNRRLAAMFMFFVPSITYWTAMVGKDALLALGTGLAAYGFALLSRHLSLSGVIAITLGLTIDFVSRPHMAAIIAVSATVALALGSNFRGVVAVATRIVVLSLVIAMTIYLATQATEIWQINDYQAGMARVQQASVDTAVGGSSFQQSTTTFFRVAFAPALIYRPFPWEVSSIQAAFAALEGLYFLILTWKSRHILRSILVNWRRNPFFVFALIFTFQFVFGIAVAISNFGLLVRQRVMILPFFLMLCCCTKQSTLGEEPLPADPHPQL